MIHSLRLTYVRFEEGHLDDYLSLVSSDQTMRYITGHGLNEEEGAARFQKALAVNQSDMKHGYFGAYAKNEIIGLIKMTPYDERRIEVGYSLRPNYWRKGFGSEMLAAMIDYLQDIPYEKLLGIVQPQNKASVALLIKYGFTETGTHICDGLEVLHYERAIK